LGDLVFFYLSLFLALALRSGGDPAASSFWAHFLPFALVYISWLAIFYIFGLYELISFDKNSCGKFLGALVICLAVGAALLYLFPLLGISPKINLLLHISIFGLLSFFFRQLVLGLFLKKFHARVAIIGQNSQVKELVDFINKNPRLGYKIAGHIKNKKNLYEEVKEKKIDILVLAEAVGSGTELSDDLYKCLSLRVDIIDLAKAYEAICGKIPLSFTSQTWFLENINERKKYFYEKIKRMLDVAGACLITVAASPLVLLIGLALKLENGGSVFFLQKRTGKDNKDFFLVKFRTMPDDAEKNGPVWSPKNDPRATKVGKILRAYHLNEIPQIINVFKGEMSLVGPRPERPEFIAKLEKTIPHYNLRHLTRPGLTGWAQVSFRYGRSEADSFEKLQYDLYYLKNRTFLLDLLIMLKTFNLLFRKEE
jgi:exopolysaccharide biosynthesis polyprenyl glycosylphosphotransferase